MFFQVFLPLETQVDDAGLPEEARSLWLMIRAFRQLRSISKAGMSPAATVISWVAAKMMTSSMNLS